MSMNPVVHFEMPAQNMERMVKFYKELFGWDVQVLGPEMGGYGLATTTPTDKNGPTKPGAINGGFYTKSKKSNQHPSIVIEVEDIHKHIEKITAAGGKVFGKVDEVPGMGLFASFVDSEGNTVGLWQNLK